MNHAPVPEATAELDLLIRGCAIVTMDGDSRVIDDGAIAIAGSRIQWLGPASEAAQTEALNGGQVVHVTPLASRA